jgi:hypothetical protein
MYGTAGFTPFFKDEKTTSAVLSVLEHVDFGFNEAQTLDFCAAKYGVDKHDMAHFWAIIKNRTDINN